MKPVLIVGAGPVGLATALSLGQVATRMREVIGEAERLGANGIVPPRFILQATIDGLNRLLVGQIFLHERLKHLSGKALCNFLEMLVIEQLTIGTGIDPPLHGAATRGPQVELQTASADLHHERTQCGLLARQIASQGFSTRSGFHPMRN